MTRKSPAALHAIFSSHDNILATRVEKTAEELGAMASIPANNAYSCSLRPISVIRGNNLSMHVIRYYLDTASQLNNIVNIIGSFSNSRKVSHEWLDNLKDNNRTND